MRIALVGVGEVGLRLATESCKLQAEIIILTDTPKPSLRQLRAETRLTNYSIEDLKNFDDCDVVVSTLSGPGEFYISVHSNILATCSASCRCKHIIPSKWNIDIEHFPNQPMFSSATHEVIRRELRSQCVQWIMICYGCTIVWVSIIRYVLC